MVLHLASATSLESVPLALLLPVLHDIRDRQGGDYRDWFDRLVADVRVRCIQVPLIVYREGDRLRVVDGETRRRAALEAGLDTVPVLILPEKPDNKALRLAQLLTNSMRRGMTPQELAPLYAELMRDNKWSQADLSRNIHVSPSQVAKVLAISSKLCPAVQALVAEGKLCPRAAYPISRLADHQQQIDIATKAVSLPMAVESVEEAVAKLLGKKKCGKVRPVKVKRDGGYVQFPGDWSWEKIVAWFTDRIESAKRGLKNNLPPSAFDNL